MLAALQCVPQWIWLVIAPIALQWPDLSGWLSADPLYLQAGLGASWVPNGVLPGLPGYIDGNSGVTLQALGRQAVHDWKAGMLPWWNPYAGVGLPLAGEMQPAAFFLPFVFLLGVADGVTYLKIALQIIGGVATWLLFRRLRLSSAAALAGGLLFEMNGTFAWVADSGALPVAFLPVILLGIENAVAAARAGAGGGWRLLCAGLAYAVLAGFPEVAFINGLLALAWASLRLCQAGGFRMALLARIAMGGVVAQMLCAPLLLAFASLLGQTDFSERDFAHSALAPGNLAMMLFPYVNGPIFFHDHFLMWYSLDGYIGLPVLCLAAAALWFGMRAQAANRALRWLLAGWIVVSIAKACDVPGIAAAWNLVPMIPHAMFARYACSSWEFCLIALATMALDDLLGLDVRTRRRGLLYAAMLAGLCACCALWAGRSVLQDIAKVPAGQTWIFAALGWGFACAAVIGVAGMARRPRPLLPMGLLLLDAATQFSVPLLAGTRGDARRLDLAPIAFLRGNMGLGRVYSLGPLTANYGSYYRVAEINHDYAPLPVSWERYIHAHLDPLASTMAFNGSSPSPADGEETRAEALRRRIGNFAAIGVNYVVALPNTDPFAMPPKSLHVPTSVVAVPMQPGQSVSGNFAPGAYDAGDIGGAAVIVSGYAGNATGRLAVTLCAGGACADGSAALDGIGNPVTLKIPLSRTLKLGADQKLDFVLAHQGGTTPMALLVWRGAVPPQGTLSGVPGLPAEHVPNLLLWPPPGRSTPRLVFRSTRMDIYEIPGAAPYFEAPLCRLVFTKREKLRADCAKPAHLTRRELYFPGWRAYVDGQEVPVSAAGLFQQISLPAGESTVRFAFAPPFVGFGYAAATLGGLCFAGSAGTRQRTMNIIRSLRKKGTSPDA